MESTREGKLSLENRLLKILQEESSTAITDRSVTVGSLFSQPRNWFGKVLQRIGLERVRPELAATIIRTEIATGSQLCDPCGAVEEIKEMTVERFLWRFQRLAEE